MIHELGGVLDKIKIAEEFLNQLETMLSEMEKELEKMESRRNFLETKLRGLAASLTSDHIVERVSTNTYYLKFSKDGLERLYKDKVKPHIHDEKTLEETLEELAEKGIIYYTTGGEKKGKPYLAGGEEAVRATLQNAMQDLMDLPVLIDLAAINNLKNKRITRDIVWILNDSEDDKLIQGSIMHQGEGGFQEYYRKSIDRLGPRVYMARLIIPVDVRIVSDVKELRKAYEELGSLVSRHVIPEARAIDIIDMDYKEITERCSMQRK